MIELLGNPLVTKLIDLSFEEDIGDGDHTSIACINENETGRSIIVAKEEGIIAGIDLAEYVFNKVDPAIQIKKFFSDGDKISNENIILEVQGSSRNILTSERTVLNFMQRLSGVATQTKKYVDELVGTKAKIIDTRKTTPGMRLLEKWAVRIGGGSNHRIGLFDMILIKDNHIDFAGGIERALEKTHQYLKEKNINLRIEIETRNVDEVRQVIKIGGVHRIMLDNFSPEMIKEALLIINGKYETEASGGITLSTLRKYAETGVNYISSGALTHSVKSIDLSLRAIK